MRIFPSYTILLRSLAAVFLAAASTALAQTTPTAQATASPTAGNTPGTAVPAPAAQASPTVRKSALRLYIIHEGDTLWDLADRIYGDPWVWPLFLKFNLYPDPNLIYPGEALWLPDKDVLLSIRNKSTEEVKEIRKELAQQGTPVPIETLPAAPTPAVTVQATPSPQTTPKPAPSASPLPTPEKTPTFKVTGSKTINMSYSEALGNSLTGTTNTGFQRHETLRLHMEGQLNDEVKITGDFNQSDLALQDDYDLTLTTKHWEFFFGNFPASLPGSQFLSSNLTTTGIRVTGKYDNFDITSFYGTPQGRPAYEKFFGNNTQGPYVIPDVPIVPSSETVWINKQKLTRGVDYTIDYTLGNLNFINRIVLLTDLIEVQAQSSASAFNTQVYGYHLDLALAGKLTPLALPTPVHPTGIGLNGMTNLPGATGTGTSNLGLAGTAGMALTQAGASAPASLGSAPASLLAPSPSPTPFQGFQWTVGQGYMRQVEQPDPNVTTATGQAAADTHMFEVDTTMNWGPALKLNGEADGSLFLSSDEAITPSKEGLAYHLQGESFQGPFHLLGKISQASPNFSNIGNPIATGNYLDWTAQADAKGGDGLFAQIDRTFQRQYSTGFEDDTTTDHGEAKIKPKNFAELDYVYYNSEEDTTNSNGPFQQDDLKNTASLTTGLPGSLTLKTSALQESQTGTDLGENDSYGGRLELASAKWKGFNFSASGEWRLNNIIEAASNTLVPVATPGTDILSQTYTYTMEGSPVTHLTLTGKGSYSNAPPGPAKANITQGYKTDPLPWLTSNGSYSLDFQQTQALGNTVPDDVHTASGSLEMTPLKWLKLSAQPSLRLDILVQSNQTISENVHQNYKAVFTPSFASFNTDYTLDQFWTWDSSTPGFPLNFQQSTETFNAAAKKTLGKVQLEVSYKRVDQNQSNISAGNTTATETLNQTETDSTAWNANSVFTFTLSHAYNQLNQIAPGQGNLSNPLLPNGVDSFNSTYPVNPQNAETYSHTFTGRVTEQLSKVLSIYEEGGYTYTVDALEGGTVNTYSPAAGFTWKLAGFLNWTASYQYNGSSGEVSTSIQKAQMTLSATLNPGANLAANWNFTQADDPFIQSQQGTVSYTMNF